MRFPSPAEDLVNALACFCEHCQAAAAGSGLDLLALRQTLQRSAREELLQWLFASPEAQTPLSAFLDSRQQTITGFVTAAVEVLRGANLEVGLDCFSPSLSRMVGQDLPSLTPLADWTKLMIYGHARGPATLPYEIDALAAWLATPGGISKAVALSEIARILGLPLPDLHEPGFFSEALMDEYGRGRRSVPDSQLLAGIELVEMPGVSELNEPQIKADLRAFRAAGADGLSLSWDLWHMPLARLKLVAQVWGSD
jgi:hypothetical protein